jgi:hypothetical protein
MSASTLILDGGLLKLPALLGALSVLYENTFWGTYIGCGSGAILAVLLGAGYSVEEITRISQGFTYLKRTWLSRIPLIGPMLCLYLKFDMYSRDFLEEWIRELLARKGVHTFKDFSNINGTFKVNLICADLTGNQIVALPNDISEFQGFTEPKDLDVAKAVRMASCGHATSLRTLQPNKLPQFWNRLFGTKSIQIFEEAELHDGVFKSPAVHVKVMRDKPTASLKYSDSCTSMFISKDDVIEPEMHFVEIDNVRGKNLMYWDDQHRIGHTAAVNMMERDFESKTGKKRGPPREITKATPNKMLKAQQPVRNISETTANTSDARQRKKQPVPQQAYVFNYR